MKNIGYILVASIVLMQIFIIYIVLATNLELENISYNTEDIARQLEIDLNY